MRLRWWELVVGGVPLLLAVLFIVGGLWFAGIVLFAVVVFAGASRAQILERNVAGSFALAKGWLALARASALLAIYLVLTVLFFIMKHHHWTHDEHGRVAFYASAALAVYVVRDIWRYGNEANDWIDGGAAEERVAEELDALREHGWLVVHNVLRDDGGGNVDHFVSGPTGGYAIETKSGRYRATDRGQAISNAIWAKAKFGQRWVTAVLCVSKEPPAEPFLARHGNSSIWVMSPAQLRPWLLAQSSPQR